ncbi:hypothetical protein SAMN02745671_01133 [Anaerovibrio lipolyticus DSM 3074]|uniref:Uncharacterized protein n=1 Tax=Anaerovibrio lipolyticus DSM 3074 TaxID=1120997 RepID=A0A1M6CJR4_9FIRM|nr:hypothetical protein [Anaerovibrio lipolyticus]SHI60938.1 hypothetical protein SAMN02745671_01133 [Anaerovibrio lipolyticus DSM 3074]
MKTRMVEMDGQLEAIIMREWVGSIKLLCLASTDHEKEVAMNRLDAAFNILSMLVTVGTLENALKATTKKYGKSYSMADILSVG